MVGHLLPLLMVFCMAANAADKYCSDWWGVDPLTIAKANETDSIEVYYLAAPLLYCTNLDEFAHIHGYHGGVGLVNRRANVNLTVSFQANPGFMQSFVPTITKLANGSYDLAWQNGGSTYIYTGINTTYWHSLMEPIATMNGTQFNLLLNWLAQANTTFPNYNPWSVYKSFPSEPYLTGFECFNFAVKMILEVNRLGAQMVPGWNQLKMSIGNAYTHTQPVKVDFNDPKWNSKIVNFYLLLEKQWGKMGFMNFLKELFNFAVKGEFFVRNNADYYYFPLHFPFFELHWRSMSIQQIADAQLATQQLTSQ
eukprot:TRINITY_DN2730_c0_g1_i1.p1 TRINITY_DN2730_c0_g1~~TRINITY_DN2730_c0_g1_i1.p1  ORF type:complete len:309 (-),score=56.45 TRINITY_DN2730_c0_g1_i1:27-953(-)